MTAVNFANKSVGGNGRNDNVTDYEELFQRDIDSACDGKNPQLFMEQIYAMMTGYTTDGNEILERPQDDFSYERDFDYIVHTYQNNRDTYDKMAQDVTFSTIYGSVALAGVSQNDIGRLNLTDYQYTGRLIRDCNGMESGQLVAFTAAEVLSVEIGKKEGERIQGNTALMNESFEKMDQLFYFPDAEERTFRCFTEGEKSAYDVTFFRHDNEKRCYIESEQPLMMGEGTVSDDFEFTAYNAKEFLSECGRDFAGNKDFVVYDIHEPERTKSLVERAENPEMLPVQLGIEMRFDGEKQPVKYFCFSDEQEARRFAKVFHKEMQAFSDAAGVTVEFKHFFSERDGLKSELQKAADSYAESSVVKAFRKNTNELFHELDGNNAESIEKMVKFHVQNILEDYGIEAVVLDAVLTGSRSRGLEREDSDVDVVVEYYGNIAEDALFELINKDYLVVAGNRIDINPITEGKTGTLDTYLAEAERYLAGMTREAVRELSAEEQKAVAENQYANFRMQKRMDNEKYDLIADVKEKNGQVHKNIAIAEFPDKAAALEFSARNGIKAVDITNCLQNRLNQKKHLMDKKDTVRTEQLQKEGTALSN